MGKNEITLTWEKYIKIFLLFLIVTICIFYFYISINNEIVGLVADDAIYLLMADYYSPYFDYLNESASFVTQASQFPPLYPMFLAFIGASSMNLVIAHFATTCCFIGSIIFYYFWVKEENITKNTALILSLVFISSPASFLMNIDLWSEHLYLLLTMCALFFIQKSHANKRYWVIVALIVGLLPLTRMVGLSFIFAFFLYLFLNKIEFRYRLFIISILPFIIWKVTYTTFISPENYENIALRFYQHDIFLIIKNLVFIQFPKLWFGWHECFDINRNINSGIVSAIILLMSLPTFFSRLIKKKIDSIYIFIYLAFIWLWPAPDHDMRFIFVIFPIFVYYSYLTLSFLLNRYISNKTNKIIYFSCIFLISATFSPTNLHAVNRLFSSEIPELSSYRNTKYWMITSSLGEEAETSIKILNQIISSYSIADKIISKGECVYASHKEQFMFYARRLALPLPLPNTVNQTNIDDRLQECEYILVLNTNTHPYIPGGYPLYLLNGKFDHLMVVKMSKQQNSPEIATLIKLH